MEELCSVAPYRSICVDFSVMLLGTGLRPLHLLVLPARPKRRVNGPGRGRRLLRFGRDEEQRRYP